MTELRRRMIEDMQLAGFSPQTQQCYVGGVRQLAKYYRRSPGQLTEEELRAFFLWLATEKKAAASTFRQYLSGIKFLYEHTLHREWVLLDLVRPPKRKKLPVVLSREEVRRLLSMIKSAKQRVALVTIYSCGLRLNEGTHLKVSDIDAERMLVWVRNGKGGRDRYVPLPVRTLKRIQAYQRRYGPTQYLFPSRDGHRPLHQTTLQRAFRDAVRRSGIDKQASIRTLRHSYATHLLESGVDLRIIQTILGHRSANTTAIYTHLTQRSVSVVRTALADLMADL